MVVLCAFCYPIIQQSFAEITDKSTLETLILFVGLIIVVPLFACFSFTYETISERSGYQMIVGHMIAFIIMLSSFLLLEMIDVLFVQMVGDILIFRATLFLMFLGILLYDFWDAARFLGQKDH